MQNDFSFPGTKPLDYKRERERPDRGFGWNLNLIREFSVDVSYYSIGGLNYLKNSVSFILFRLIFQPKITLHCHITFRGMDHDVG